MKYALSLAGLTAAGLALSACAAPHTTPPTVMSTKSAVQLRAMQARLFDTADRYKVMQAVVGTMQDIGYTLEKVDPEAGTISAVKLALLRLTVTVNPKGASQVEVRANAIAIGGQVDAPDFYTTRFFEPLAKAMALSALQEDDATPPASPPSAPATAADAAKTN